MLGDCAWPFAPQTAVSVALSPILDPGKLTVHPGAAETPGPWAFPLPTPSPASSRSPGKALSCSSSQRASCGSREPTAPLRSAPAVLRVGPQAGMVSVAWHSLAMPALAHPDGARSGGGPSPHLASASGDLNGRTDGRGRGDVTPQPGKRARTPRPESPGGRSPHWSRRSPHPRIRHVALDVRHQALTCCGTPSLSTARALEARIPCWNLRGSQHPGKERTCSVVLLHVTRACNAMTRACNAGPRSAAARRTRLPSVKQDAPRTELQLHHVTDPAGWAAASLLWPVLPGS